MIRINLLPTEEVERAADQRQQIATVGLVVAVGVLVQAIVGPYAEVLKIQAQQKELQEKLDVITKLEARSGGPVRVLTDLATATPDKLWLTEFAEVGGNAKMSGFSVDEQTIADFLRRLGASSYFAGVDLEETTQVTQENVKQKKFTLRASVNYAGTTPPAPKPSEHKKTAAAASPMVTASREGVTP